MNVVIGCSTEKPDKALFAVIMDQKEFKVTWLPQALAKLLSALQLKLPAV